MKILLLTSFYPPEIRSISTMMRELAEGLVARGHTVTVITPQPKDNLPDKEKGKVWPTFAQEGAVKVVRIRTLGQKTKNYVLRGLSELTLPLVYRRAIRKFAPGTIDGVIVYIPHFTLTQVGAWVKKKYGARYILNVQDIFPQNAIDAGIMKSKALIKFYEYLERRAYKAADALTTHTNGGREFLIKNKGVLVDKISTMYNWIDVDTFVLTSLPPPPSPTREDRDSGSFRKQYGLEGKFIFLFAGIFGPTQGLKLIIELARRVADLSEIRFLFVGDGTEKEYLSRLVKAYNLTNVYFEPFVTPKEYPALLKEMDVGLMCLAPSNTTAVVPGKLWGYMAAGLPILAFLQKQSEGHRIINEAHCGYSVVSDDIGQAEAVVRRMYAERPVLKGYGKNGREYARSHFSREQCIGRLERLLVSR